MDVDGFDALGAHGELFFNVETDWLHGMHVGRGGRGDEEEGAKEQTVVRMSFVRR